MSKQSLFSCGTEAQDWLDVNCERCWKGARLKPDGEYTKSHCAIYDDIIGAWMGDGCAKKQKTYDCVSQRSCPIKEEKRPTYSRKTDRYKNEPSLF